MLGYTVEIPGTPIQESFLLASIVAGVVCYAMNTLSPLLARDCERNWVKPKTHRYWDHAAINVLMTMRYY
jgi:hypothetical protein